MTGQTITYMFCKHMPQLTKYAPWLIRHALNLKMKAPSLSRPGQEDQARNTKVNIGKDKINLEGYGTDDVLKLLGFPGLQQTITQNNARDDHEEPQGTGAANSSSIPMNKMHRGASIRATERGCIPAQKQIP